MLKLYAFDWKDNLNIVSKHIYSVKTFSLDLDPQPPDPTKDHPILPENHTYVQ